MSKELENAIIKLATNQADLVGLLIKMRSDLSTIGIQVAALTAASNIKTTVNNVSGYEFDKIKEAAGRILDNTEFEKLASNVNENIRDIIAKTNIAFDKATPLTCDPEES